MTDDPPMNMAPALRVASVHAVRFAGTVGEVVQTLEGPVAASPGDAIVTGVLGETWPVARAEFRRTYVAARGTRFGAAGRYRRLCEHVAARPTASGATQRRVAGGVLTGESGDFLVRNACGRERIVARDVFARTYVWDSPTDPVEPPQTVRYARFERDLRRNRAADAALTLLDRAAAVLARTLQRGLGAAIDPQRPVVGCDRVAELAARYTNLVDGGVVASAAMTAAALTLVIVTMAVGVPATSVIWATLTTVAAVLLGASCWLQLRLPDWRARTDDYRALVESPTSVGAAALAPLEPGGPWWRIVARAAQAPSSVASTPAAGTTHRAGSGATAPEAAARRSAPLDVTLTHVVHRNGQRVATMLTALAGAGLAWAALARHPELSLLSSVPIVWAIALRWAIAALVAERRHRADVQPGVADGRIGGSSSPPPERAQPGL